jgi:hypothetical protein
VSTVLAVLPGQDPPEGGRSFPAGRKFLACPKRRQRKTADESAGNHFPNRRRPFNLPEGGRERQKQFL